MANAANAAGSGRPLVLNTLISASDIEKFKNILEYGSTEKFIEAFTLLKDTLKISPNVLLKTEYGINYPLLYFTSNPSKLQYLVSQGANVDLTYLNWDAVRGEYFPDTLLYNRVFIWGCSSNDSTEYIKFLLDNGADASFKGRPTDPNVFEMVISKYNKNYRPGNTFHDAIIELTNLFLTHPGVKEKLGKAEFNRIKARMVKPFNQTVLEYKKHLNNSYKFPKFYGQDKYSRQKLIKLKKGFHPTPNMKSAVEKWSFEKTMRNRHINKSILNQIGNYVGGPRSVSGVQIEPLPKGPGSESVVTPAVPGQSMRYNIALALQHPNQWALPNKVANTRKRKSRGNKKTRRSRRA